VKKSGLLSTVGMKSVTRIGRGVIYNQRFTRSSSFTLQEKTVTMAGKVGQATAAAAVSTGGSLISDAKLRQLYTTMVECRLLTERVCRLRGQRSASLYAASMGQEAIATGCAIDLQPEDTIALAPQNAIAGLVKGVPLGDIVAQIYTHPIAQGQSPNVIMPSPTQCTQLGLATSVALANKQKKKSNVVVAFSDKASIALGCWQEAFELAASKNLPIIFVVEDNPRTDPASFKASDEEDAPTGKARSYGFPIIPVDANDVVAVYRVTHESVERVRQGGGPVLVEGKLYRLFSQTKRRVANSAAWRSEIDPLTHMERYLKAKGLFTRSWKDQVVQEFSRKLDSALRDAKKKSG
jgi:TPP-dependent pyruvate/acetoin dehydrogenase alpha subunit